MSSGYIVQSILIIIFAPLFIRQYAIHKQTNSTNNIPRFDESPDGAHDRVDRYGLLGAGGGSRVGSVGIGGSLLSRDLYARLRFQYRCASVDSPAKRCTGI